MKILTVIPYFAPAYYFGGPVRVTHELTRRLALRGHQVDVYTTDVLDGETRNRQREDMIDGVRVRHFRNINHRMASRHHAFLPMGFCSAVRDSCSAYDLVHIHEYYTLMAAAAARSARLHGRPFLLSAHGSLPVTPERGNQGRKALFNRLLKKMIFSGISRVIALNEREQEQYATFGVAKDRIEIVPNGIDVREYRDLPDGSGFRSRHGIRDKDTVILFVGRVHEIKGLDILVKAFKDVSGPASGVKLAIVGPDDGYLRTLLDRASALGVRQNLVVTGLLSGADKLSAYAAADLFVLPSRSEGFPVTALEACASGLPVIITDQCNFPEVGRSGAGLVVQGSESSLAEAVRTLLHDPARRREMGRRGREMVFDRYDWDRIVLQLERVYEDAIRRP